MARKVIDISGYLVDRFRARYRGGNWRFDCPFCFADRERFTVSIPKGITHCWKCGYTKPILTFVSEVESVTIGGAFQVVRQFAGIKVPEEPVKAKPDRSRFRLRIPGYYTLGSRSQPSEQERMAWRYLKNRGITEEDIQFWKLGLSRDDKYIGRIIVPFIEDDRVKYFVARKFTGPGPKYMNPDTSNYGIGKSELLFNLESASTFDEIAISEGVFDAIAIGRNSVALLGKVISHFQFEQILSCAPTRINICLDSDAKKEAYDLAEKFAPLIPTEITIYKNGDPAEYRVAPHGSKTKVRYSLRSHLRRKIGTFTDSRRRP